jgi:hypothetical protein
MQVLVAVRGVLLLIGALSLVVGGWVVRAQGSVAPTPEAPVVVGSTRLPADELEAAAARRAHGRPARLPGARKAVASRAVERLWLEGEARARRLVPARDLGVLRGQVADALAGPGPGPDAAQFAARFGAFHERWRERTRCLPAYRDPYEDRCGDGADAAAGTCRWMGEATICTLQRGVRGRWLVVREAPSARATHAAAARLPHRLASRLRADVVRLRSRGAALAVARAFYVVAREARMLAAKRAAVARAAAAARARLARERQERARDPRLTGTPLTAARDACRRQLRDSDPYLFGFGLQDMAGQAHGLIAARAALGRALLASASDAIDRHKLQPLVDAIAAGNHELGRLAASSPSSDPATVAERTARFATHVERERALSRRLGLGDCLAQPE